MNKVVAVYGSLRKGHGNHRILASSEFLSEFRTDDTWEMFSLGGFPGIRDGESSILVELYKVTSEDVAFSLDCLEGFRDFDDPSNFYNKEFIETPYGEAEIYTLQDYTPTDSSIVQDGDWTSHRFSTGIA